MRWASDTSPAATGGQACLCQRSSWLNMAHQKCSLMRYSGPRRCGDHRACCAALTRRPSSVGRHAHLPAVLPLHAAFSPLPWSALQVGMKCVALAGRQPVYELGAADLVVRDLSQLSFVNLKQLFAAEERVAGQVRCRRLHRCWGSVREAVSGVVWSHP